MKRHLGRREREARKLRRTVAKRGKWNLAVSDSFGVVTLKLGRKKSSEAFGMDSRQLKKKFPGCVVNAER